MKTDLDGDAVLARLCKQVIEFAERSDGKWAGRFKEYLERARPVAPHERIGAPLCLVHMIVPVRLVRDTAWTTTEAGAPDNYDDATFMLLMTNDPIPKRRDQIMTIRAYPPSSDTCLRSSRRCFARAS